MNPNPQGPMESSSQAPELGSMTAPSENPSREAMSSRRSFLGPRTMIRLATWNVRTMFETGKTAQVTKEMERYDLDILGVSECRWTGAGMSPERIPKVALRWTHAGKRKRGRPKTTWRKTVETELSEMGLSWREA